MINNFFDWIAARELQGKWCLAVNIATQCGYTPQLKDLQLLHETVDSTKFVIVAMPSNEFKQNTQNDKETLKFCETHYHTKFIITELIDSSHTVWQWLSNSAPIEWNFEKFLIDPRGRLMRRYPSSTSIDIIQQDINRIVR